MTVHGKVQPNVRPKAQAKAPVSFYDRFWRFFASVRLAIVLIFLIAAAAVLGSLIQQVEQQTNYRVRDHLLQLYGICPACQKKSADSVEEN